METQPQEQQYYDPEHPGPGAGADADTFHDYNDPRMDLEAPAEQARSPSPDATSKTGLVRSIRQNKRRRRICICLGVTVIFMVIFIPILILVIVPAIAQANIDGSKLRLDTATISGATSNGFLLSSQGAVEDAGAISAKISFEGGSVDVAWTGDGTNGTDIPLAKINGMPDLNVDGKKKGGDLSITNANVEIVDGEAMGKFARFMMLSPSFEWKLTGKAVAKAFGLTMKGLKMDKTVKMKAFDGLRNISIITFDLPRNDPAGGIQIVTSTLMDNPSTMTVELGNIDFGVSFEGSTIGTLAAKNVTLIPGPNTLPLNGRLLTTTNPTALKALSQMFTSYIAGQPANMTVTGSAVVPPSGGADWLSKGFVGLPLSVSLVPPTPQKLISDIRLGDMDVRFLPSDPSGSSAAVNVAALNAKFKSPLAFPLKISQVQQRMTITDPSNVDIATLEAPTAQADGDSVRGTLVTSVGNGTLAAIKGKEAQYAQFLKALLIQETVPFPLKGISTVQANTAAGVVTISNVPVVDSPTVKGMNGLRQISITSVAVKGGTTSGIQLDIGTQLVNPSQMSLAGLGEIVLDMIFENQRIGTVTLPDTGIQRGTNSITAGALFSPDPGSPGALQAGRTMLTNFLNGRSSTITIVGTSSSSRIPSLQPGVAALTIPTVLNGIQPTLIQSTTLYLNGLIGTIVTQSASVTIALTNPFDAPFTLLNLDSTVRSQGQVIGVIESQTLSSVFTIPGKSSGTTPQITMNLKINGAAIQGLLQSVGGNLFVDVTADMRVKVGDYETTVSYAQNGVKTSLGGLFPK